MKTPEDHEREQAMRVAEYRRDAAPIDAQLRGLGEDLDSIILKRNLGLDYKEAIPILLTRLTTTESRVIKSCILHALAVPAARPLAGPLLIREFYRTASTCESPGTSVPLWDIGNALEFHACDDLADNLIGIATEKRFGWARAMVVLGLTRLKDSRAFNVLVNLLDDPDVNTMAVTALAKLKNPAARPHLERFVNHPDRWIRREARKGIERLDKAAARTGNAARPSGAPEGGAPNKKAKRVRIPRGLSETSVAIGMDRLGPFLKRVAECTAGMEFSTIDDLVETVDRLDNDRSRLFGYQVEYESTPTPLVIKVQKDDVDSVGIYFHTSAALVSRIEALFHPFCEEHGA
ncbi:MAG: HEAT repeat domain-containing protein [Phycisphaerales bacterium]|nr:HEAT repeat domain-containing protein [Phycisphaerales bacterium]